MRMVRALESVVDLVLAPDILALPGLYEVRCGWGIAGRDVVRIDKNGTRSYPQENNITSKAKNF
jgi:hypothetical protein